MKIMLGICPACSAPIFPESDFRGYYCTGCLDHQDITYDVGNHFNGVKVVLENLESVGTVSGDEDEIEDTEGITT